jgi:aryl-alcohol dehydrogenase-like predicted oxidoreductase
VTAALALGTAQLAQAYGVANHRVSGAAHDPRAILDAARERGIRWVDTAPAYGDAERVLGRYLAEPGRAGAFRVCSKLSPLPAELPARELRAYVGRAIDQTRGRVGCDRIDAYLVHAASDLATHGAALVDALAAARERGAVGRIGVSVYEPSEAFATLAIGTLDAIQYPFHLFDRRMAESGVVAKLRTGGWLCFARSALLQGLFALAPDALPATLEAGRPWLTRLAALAGEHGTTPVALALGFAVHHSGADFVVVGADDAAQVHAACDATGRPMPGAAAEASERAFTDVPGDVRDPRRWRATGGAS